MQLQILVKNRPGANRFVQIDDAQWSLDTWDVDDAGHEPYSCVSYAWGRGKVANPFHEGTEASDRTIPALRTVTRRMPDCQAVWIDAFCVPGQDTPSQRAATLESMGYIYSRAQSVIVVLSAEVAPALRHIQQTRGAKLQTAHLDALEREEWYSRAWTYQETANSKSIVFASVVGADEEVDAEDAVAHPVIDVMELFSPLGEALAKLGAGAHKQYPRLNDLEDMLADTAVASYHMRSAFQVMTIMEKRTQERADDHFYAMIGAITSEPASAAGGLSACEAFMSLCEKKGDFSFIYSAAPREETRPWRPASDNHGGLPVVFARHNWGQTQPGHFADGKLFLDNMMRLRRGALNGEARDFIKGWIKWSGVEGDDAPLAAVVAELLFEYDFKGSGTAIAVEHGLFYPWKQLSGDGDVSFVAVSGGVRWNIGAPALARYDDGKVEYVPGVFVGPFDTILPEATSICVEE